jgi:F0F1-type ATP synthase assembly protein I
MEAVSGEKKIKGLYKQIYEEMKKARRREKYLSCFAVFVALICLALVGCAFGWFIAIIIESIYYR